MRRLSIMFKPNSLCLYLDIVLWASKMVQCNWTNLTMGESVPPCMKLLLRERERDSERKKKRGRESEERGSREEVDSHQPNQLTIPGSFLTV